MTQQVNTEELKENISRRSTWLRLLYMILFVIFLGIAEMVLSVLIIVQFGIVLLSGSANEDLRRFLHAVTRYVYDGLQFLTFNSEELPFPFRPWDYGVPASGATGGPRPARKKPGRKKAGKKAAGRKTGGR